MSEFGTFETWRPALTMSVSRVPAQPVDDQNDTFDPEPTFSIHVRAITGSPGPLCCASLDGTDTPICEQSESSPPIHAETECV
jgi:hypothetical protein